MTPQRKPFLTIAYPVYSDFDGLYFSALDIPLTHAEVCDQVEILVVDNNPDSAPGRMTRDWVNGHLRGAVRARYIDAPGPGGPALAKQRCVDEAAAEYVLVMDSHVRIVAGGIAKLIDHYLKNPLTLDLFSGPMFYDAAALLAGQGAPLSGFATHMDAVWRGENLGIWATDPRGAHRDAEPFEVPAMGCGLFSTAKRAFVGFNPHFRGFGGEEVYIHEKTRRAGGRAICLPFLRWVHRFGRPAGVPYPLTRYAKVRNYVLWHQELGWPLDGVHKEFCEPGVNDKGEPRGPLMGAVEWNWLLEDPVGHTTPKPAQAAKSGCGGCNQPASAPAAKPAELPSLEKLYQTAAQTPSDINQHVPKLRELAAACMVVVEFGHRRGVSTAGLLAGQPQRLVSYDLNEDPFWKVLKARQGKTQFEFIQGNVLDVEIPECDLLFEDSRHTADHVYAVLAKHAGKVRRWLAFHDTQIYGENGEDGGPGILPALRRWMKEHPEWIPVYHTQANHGFTVLSRDPADRPPLPSGPRMVLNYAKAIARHVASGSKVAPAEEIDRRLDLCALCEHRTENRCSICGCFLDEGPGGRDGKAVWAESFCPIGKW